MAKGYKTGGRKPGSPNRTTREARIICMAFLNRRTEAELEELWTLAKSESATKALRLYLDALEFQIPKLARHEVTGNDGEPLQILIRTYGEEK